MFSPNLLQCFDKMTLSSNIFLIKKEEGHLNFNQKHNKQIVEGEVENNNNNTIQSRKNKANQ